MCCSFGSSIYIAASAGALLFNPCIFCQTRLDPLEPLVGYWKNTLSHSHNRQWTAVSTATFAKMEHSGSRLVRLLLLVACCGLQALGRGDYYDLLQVPRGAGDAQIKRSYRKLALKYHPDKVTGTEDEKKKAAEKFAEINHAYEILSDEEKRRIYDRYGEDGLKQHMGQQAQGHHGGGSIFDFFFGGGQGGEDEEDRVPKGHTVMVDLYVSLADLYTGKEFKVIRDKAVIVPGPGKRKCKCKQKLVTKQLGPGMFQQFHKQVCEECPGYKLEREQEVVAVHVEAGMVNGQTITFFEEGEPMIDGEPGDLQFVVRTLPSARWERRGHDLLINETITLVDALTGFRRAIHHLDGHEVVLQATGITKPGDYHYIEGEGMPIQNQEPKRGNLFVFYSVAFPVELSEGQKQAVRDLLKDTPMPVPPAA